MKNIPAKLLLLVTILVAFLVISSDREQAKKEGRQMPEKRSVEWRGELGLRSLPIESDGELPASQLAMSMGDRRLMLASVSLQ
ncbi:hypothetical protein [Phragmitibacter flavus]|nr:hypothetical protein [Phragmitibacter flavus]